MTRTKTRPGPQGAKLRRGLLAAVYAASLAVGLMTTAAPALAGRSSDGGRIYDPSRQRIKKSSPETGRTMRRPPIPDPESQRPLRSTAKIPNPEPHARGGSGYSRNGKYFYEQPQPPQLTRQASGQRPGASIPNPEFHKRRAKSAALR